MWKYSGVEEISKYIYGHRIRKRWSLPWCPHDLSNMDQQVKWVCGQR